MLWTYFQIVRVLSGYSRGAQTRRRGAAEAAV
jgi:hypothetical protein